MFDRDGDIAMLALIGIIYGFFRMGSKKLDTPTDPSSPQGGVATSQVLPDKWEIIYEVDGYSQNVVWMYSTSMGLLYESGDDNRYYEDYFLIGNQTHTGFVTDSSSVGHLNTPFGRAKAYPNTGVAVQELNRMASAPSGGPSTSPPPSEPSMPTTDYFGGTQRPNLNF